MLDKELCQKILTVGCFYKEPTGGISQVLHTYSQCVFKPFKFVATTSKGGRMVKLAVLANGFVKFVLLLIFDRKIKIVHIHTASNNSFKRKSIFVMLAKAFGKRVVLHVHSGAFLDYFSHNQDFVKSVFAKCDSVVALSDYWQKELRVRCGAWRVDVIDNVIVPPSGDDVVKRHADGKVHFLFLGLYKKEKGIFDLLDVVEAAHYALAGKCVLHVGCDKGEEIERRIAETGIGDVVTYEGWVSGQEKERLLAMCDVYVLPSYIEGVPISILECMSHGMAILATNVGGIPSVVMQEKNGLLCDAGNKQQLHDAIMQFVENKTLVERMGKASLEMVTRYYPENVAEELKKLYESLLA